jgi:RND family efflux transporter MFP subunit
VAAGATLLTVTDVSTLSVTAEVDETDVLLVRRGVAAEVELDAVPGARYSAKVASVDVAPTASGRGGVSYVVRLSLASGTDAEGDPAPRPRPGMSAVVDLQVRTARAVTAVPAAAVFRDGPRDAVWVAAADGTARKRIVRLGAEGEDRVEVRDGLKVGDRVVVRGADRVSEGQQVP